jgi:hypothetical protein
MMAAVQVAISLQIMLPAILRGRASRMMVLQAEAAMVSGDVST